MLSRKTIPVESQIPAPHIPFMMLFAANSTVLWLMTCPSAFCVLYMNESRAGTPAPDRNRLFVVTIPVAALSASIGHPELYAPGKIAPPPWKMLLRKVLFFASAHEFVAFW